MPDTKFSAESNLVAPTDTTRFAVSQAGVDGYSTPLGLRGYFGYYEAGGSPEGAVTASVGDIYQDTINGNLYQKRSGAGTNTGWQLISYPRRTNYSTASQGPLTASATTYLVGSELLFPLTGLQPGTRMYWTLVATKTAGGALTNNFDVRIGTAGTTADTSRLSFPTGAGTAVADTAIIEIWAHMRSTGSGTSAVIVGGMKLSHGLAATGWSTVPVVTAQAISGGFDSTVANLRVGISMTTAASMVPTFQLVEALMDNL